MSEGFLVCVFTKCTEIPLPKLYINEKAGPEEKVNKCIWQIFISIAEDVILRISACFVSE